MFVSKIGAVDAPYSMTIPGISHSDALKNGCLNVQNKTSNRIFHCLHKSAAQILSRQDQLRVVFILKNTGIS